MPAFGAIYNLHGRSHLDEMSNIAVMLELQSLFPSPRSIPVSRWRVNRIVSPSPPVENEVNNSSPVASPEINTCDTF
jgi:hypothetical protein